MDRFNGGKLDQTIRNKFSQQWGKVKFRPQPYKGRSSGLHDTPVEETTAATPWKHVKNNIIDSELEERNAGNVNMESKQAKEFLKKREQNYRRNLIEEKRKEATTWEKFCDNDDGAGKKNTINNFKTTKPQKDSYKNAFKDRKQHIPAGKVDNDNGKGTSRAGKKNTKNNFKTTNPQQDSSRMTFKERKQQLLAGKIKPEELTFKDRNFVRQKLTKSTLMAKGSKFTDAFRDLKMQMKHIKKN